MRSSGNLVLAIALLALAACTAKEEGTAATRIPVVICFDVEDYTSPESVGMDDIPKWLAEIMTEEGVTGTFFVIGEKARWMEKRGRRDVIDAMAKHDIGSHTNYGSIHPTVTELLEDASWDKGIDVMLENESAGIDELERIFGQRPVTLGRHGGSYGPQLPGALSQLNVGYVYSPVGLPGHNVVWFCNTLNFRGGANYGSFDDTYHDDELFNPMLEALDSIFPASIEDIDMTAFFANHPSKIRSIRFWDLNYYKGANPGPEEWVTPELRPLKSMKTAQKNFRRLMRYLKNRDDIELTTYRDLIQRFACQREKISRKELGLIAERILQENRVVIDDYYSPAEIFAALSDALSQYSIAKELPGEINIRRSFGPLEMPIEDPEVDHIPVKGVLELSVEAKEYIGNTGHLPTLLNYNGRMIGTGSILALFSELYLKIEESNLPEKLSTVSFESYHSANEKAIISKIAGFKEWSVHREDLDMSRLIEMTKLQLWTLKPAHDQNARSDH